MVIRQRLLDRFAVLRPLTLVSAPAGYGKTVLVDSWAAASRAQTVVRVVLDEDPAAPRDFWAAVVETLHRSGVDVSDVTLPSAEGPDLRSLVRHLAAHDRDVAMVLDTGEFSLPDSVGAGLDWVIRRCRKRLRVILLTRIDPPLPLHRYRLDGAITELRAADLAFTAEEVPVLMERQGLDLAPADVSMLQARTAGWPAGLRFAAMTLADCADVTQAVEDFRGDTGNVAEYLFSEVLSKQSSQTREFLLRTCVADELDPELVEALIGQDCDLHQIERMAGSNAFVERVRGKRDRYRYQPLFLEFLRGQLAAERPDLVGELHRVTAEWLADDDKVFAAIRHAAVAGEWPTATDLLVTRLGFVWMLVGWKSDRLRALFRDLPPELPGTAAAITRAALSISGLDIGRGERHLAVAQKLVSSQTAAVPPTHALAVAVLTALEASLGADTGAGLSAALAAERTLRLTASTDTDALLKLIALVAGCKARVLFERGDLEAAAQVLADGGRAAEAGHFDDATSELRGMAAVVEAANGHLRRATELALEVLPTVSDPDDRLDGPGLQAASLALAWVRIDQSAVPPPLELLAQADRQHASYDSRVLASVLALLRARLLHSDNQDSLALVELRGVDEVVGTSGFAAPATGWLAAQLVVAEATCLLGLGRADEALTLLEGFDGPRSPSSDLVLHRAHVAAGHEETDASESAEPITEGPLATQVDSLLLSAERRIERGARPRSTEFLVRALRMGAREQLRRPFLEAGEELHTLIDRMDQAGRINWLRTPAATLTGGVFDGHHSVRPSEPEAADPAVPLIVMPLTTKENEVLGYLAELLTTDEIAATMFVSVNTVRSHLRSILRKLGASRRNEAVRRAWDLGLLIPEDPTTPSLAR